MEYLVWLDNRDPKYHKVEHAKVEGFRENFIESPRLLYESKASDSDKIIYLELLSRRNYYDFKINEETRLHTDFAFGFAIEKLKNNRLLTITGDYISFNLK